MISILSFASLLLGPEWGRVQVSVLHQFFFLVLLYMQASIACVLGLVTCQRNIHKWETVAPKFTSLHSRSWISRTGLKLMFFDISLYKRLPPPHTFYKHIVAVKATINKQSPHSKLLLNSFF